MHIFDLEAEHDLSATAEFLVLYHCNSNKHCSKETNTEKAKQDHTGYHYIRQNKTYQVTQLEGSLILVRCVMVTAVCIFVLSEHNVSYHFLD